MARVTLDTKKKFELFKLLQANLVPIPGTDFVRYKEGWSDEKVRDVLSQKVNGPVNVITVARVRRESIGDLEGRRAAGGVVTRLDSIERNITDLSAALKLVAEKVGVQLDL